MLLNFFMEEASHMQKNCSNFEQAKAIIRQGIKDKLTFEELRAKLPDWRKRPLTSLIFDVMAEKKMKHVPFPGLLKRPRLARKPIKIDAEGNLSVKELLKEKGFMGRCCLAYAHIGDNKITLTIKPGNLPEERDPEIYG